VGVDVRPHLDLLDLDDLLVLARFGRLFLVGVFQLAEIEDLGDGRLRVRGDFDEIEARLFGGEQGVIDRYNAAICAFCIDELDLGDANVPVGTRPFLRGRCGFEWSANGRGLLAVSVRGSA
jgi:hypothetical protein